MPMRFKEGTFYDPYKVVSNYLVDYISYHGAPFDSLILDIETTVLGRENVFASLNTEEEISYSFNTDWYEGGDIILHGFTYLGDVPTLNEI